MTDSRYATIHAHVTPALRADVQALADRKGITPSALIRTAVIRYVRKATTPARSVQR